MMSEGRRNGPFYLRFLLFLKCEKEIIITAANG